jgi:hypothetical protein
MHDATAVWTSMLGICVRLGTKITPPTPMHPIIKPATKPTPAETPNTPDGNIAPFVQAMMLC